MKPTLFVLAAGMGSRYGGLKQLDGVGPHGETIMDYSIYDAIHSGFGKVVFVIRHDFEQEFRDKILSKYEGHIPVDVVFQDKQTLPEGFSCPPEREKPWGTNHAVMMAEGTINEPFAVINADDFYGRNSFEVIGRFLSELSVDSKGKYCMVAFKVGRTMTDFGSVARGVCNVKNGMLDNVVERTAISYDDEKRITFKDENGKTQYLAPDTPVSMNFWGLTPDYFGYSVREFVKFLNKYISEPKREFYIPSVVDKLIHNNEATVDVLTTDSKWFGVTYAQDRPTVVASLARLHEEGVYPEKLF